MSIYRRIIAIPWWYCYVMGPVIVATAINFTYPLAATYLSHLVWP